MNKNDPIDFIIFAIGFYAFQAIVAFNVTARLKEASKHYAPLAFIPIFGFLIMNLFSSQGDLEEEKD